MSEEWIIFLVLFRSFFILDTKKKPSTTQNASLSGISSTQGKSKKTAAIASRDVQKIHMKMGADKKSSSTIISVITVSVYLLRI